LIEDLAVRHVDGAEAANGFAAVLAVAVNAGTIASSMAAPR
jgi:hypothetical protein